MFDSSQLPFATEPVVSFTIVDIAQLTMNTLVSADTCGVYISSFSNRQKGCIMKPREPSQAKKKFKHVAIDTKAPSVNSQVRPHS